MKQLSPVAPKIPWTSTIFVLKYVEHAFGDDLSSVSVICPSHSGCLMKIPILQDWILMIPDTPLGSTRLPGSTPVIFCFANPREPRLFVQRSFVAVHVQTQQDGVEDDHPGHEQSKGAAIQLRSRQPSLIVPSALTKTTKKKSKK